MKKIHSFKKHLLSIYLYHWVCCCARDTVFFLNWEVQKSIFYRIIHTYVCINIDRFIMYYVIWNWKSICLRQIFLLSKSICSLQKKIFPPKSSTNLPLKWICLVASFSLILCGYSFVKVWLTAHKRDKTVT